MEIEKNDNENIMFTQLNEFMKSLEIVDPIYLINRLRKFLMIDYSAKYKTTHQILKSIFKALWNSKIPDERNHIGQAVENYLVSPRANQINSNAFLVSLSGNQFI